MKRGGGMDEDYFLKVLNFIGMTVNKEMKVSRVTSVRERRALPSNQQEEKAKIVREQVIKEDKVAQQIAQEVLTWIGVEPKLFKATHQSMIDNIETKQLVLAAQRGQLTKPTTTEPSMTMQRTLELY